MGNILDIAARVSTPLALGGLIVGALFLIFRQILAMNIFPQLSRQLGGKIIIKIINTFLTLALVAIILGFISYVLPTIMNAYYPKLDREYVNVGTDEDQTLENIVRAVALGQNVTINFNPNCDQATRSAVIEAGDHEGNSIKEFLEHLKQRVKGQSIDYTVAQEGERRYEINCR
ncbi:MAG: hypothetical protein H7Z16_05615 [Pyrinomonadaceae bacterium]|nr:hypothetical protein [Pyrinomonadaceae bacterium]